MELIRGDVELEDLNTRLNDDTERAAYKARYDHYRTGVLPRVLGGFFILCGDLVYGRRPSYLKFRAIEVIARVPYHSWSAAMYTLLTLFYRSEHRALRYARVSRFAQLAQDNETMHVVVISHLCEQERRGGWIRHVLVPLWFAFFYYWWSYALYLVNPRWSYELNFLFEAHAYQQYSRFVEQHEHALRGKPVRSEFLAWYGRRPANQYEFFVSVRNDELIHRNRSIEEIEHARALA